MACIRQLLCAAWLRDESAISTDAVAVPDCNTQ